MEDGGPKMNFSKKIKNKQTNKHIFVWGRRISSLPMLSSVQFLI
jgi:hypothetical protein